MNKFSSFKFNEKSLNITFIETLVIKEGVICDVYKFDGDATKDLAIVHVKKGNKTPEQKVLKGEKTTEGYVDGKRTLTLVKPDSSIRSYKFPGSNKKQIEVKIGEIMQWEATEDLTFFEICEPPYEEGRYQNLD